MSESDQPVVYRHARFVALLKPAGVSVHSEDGSGFVVQASERLQMPLLPVHRLDKGTSGLLLAARDSEAAAELAALFAAHRVEKYYVGISARRSHKKQGRVSGDMLPARNGSWRLAHSKQAPAITDFVSAGLGNGARAFLLRPITGKTHQLRVALKSQGAPLLGDERYGGAVADRLYLHAWQLRFSAFGDAFVLQAPITTGAQFLMPAFQLLLARWQEPWEQFSSVSFVAESTQGEGS